MKEILKTLAVFIIAVWCIVGTYSYLVRLRHEGDVVDGILVCGSMAFKGKYIKPIDNGRWKVTSENGLIMYVSPPPTAGCVAYPTGSVEETTTEPRATNPKTETSAT